MKTELEVARDAVRQAGLEELADALEWAAAAVRHRSTLLHALGYMTVGEGACIDCRARWAEPHSRNCRWATARRVLDPGWSPASPQPAQPQPEDEPADE